jgi:hypothetical protein
MVLLPDQARPYNASSTDRRICLWDGFRNSVGKFWWNERGPNRRHLVLV